MDLLEMTQKSQQKVRDLMHNGVTQEHIEMIVLNSLCDEILQELDGIEKYNEVKSALKNMFFLGQITIGSQLLNTVI